MPTTQETATKNKVQFHISDEVELTRIQDKAYARNPTVYNGSYPVTPISSVAPSRATSAEDLTQLEAQQLVPTINVPSTRAENEMQARPIALKSWTHEILFVLACSMGQMLTQVNTGNGAVSLLVIQKSLGLDDAQLPWISGAFTLANGSFVIFFGSMADRIGAKKVFVTAMFWMGLWSLVAGTSKSPYQFFIARAMQGIGGGALIPSGISLLGFHYEPGRRKNRVFSAFGAMGPIGFIGGAIEAGVILLFAKWNWIFYFNAILLASFGVMSYFVIPSDENKRIKDSLHGFDWLGSLIAISGLVLVVFGFTDGPVASWAPYTYSLLVIGVLLLVIFVFVEKYVAKDPIMPIEIWRTPSFGMLMLASILGWAGFTGWQFYVALFWLKIKKASPILTAAYFGPNGVIGVLATFVCASTLHILPGHYIFAASCLCFGLGPVFFLPLSYYPELSYWYTGFPAVILTTFGPDLSFAAASIFVTSSVRRKHQGTAGSLVNTIINIGQAVGTGLAGIVESAVANQQKSTHPSIKDRELLLVSYRAVWWFCLAIAMTGLGLTILFVRIPKTDEKNHTD